MQLSWWTNEDCVTQKPWFDHGPAASNCVKRLQVPQIEEPPPEIEPVQYCLFTHPVLSASRLCLYPLRSPPSLRIFLPVRPSRFIFPFERLLTRQSTLFFMFVRIKINLFIVFTIHCLFVFSLRTSWRSLSGCSRSCCWRTKMRLRLRKPRYEHSEGWVVSARAFLVKPLSPPDPLLSTNPLFRSYPVTPCFAKKYHETLLYLLCSKHFAERRVSSRSEASDASRERPSAPCVVTHPTCSRCSTDDVTQSVESDWIATSSSVCKV